jgi:hypothetical protein
VAEVTEPGLNCGFLTMAQMGVGGFPVPETLLLQTQMFSTCFQFQHFYAKATIYLCAWWLARRIGCALWLHLAWQQRYIGHCSELNRGSSPAQ